MKENTRKDNEWDRGRFQKQSRIYLQNIKKARRTKLLWKKMN